MKAQSNCPCHRRIIGASHIKNELNRAGGDEPRFQIGPTAGLALSISLVVSVSLSATYSPLPDQGVSESNLRTSEGQGSGGQICK